MKEKDTGKRDDFELEDNDGFIEDEEIVDVKKIDAADDEFYQNLFKKEGLTVEESSDELPQADIGQLLGLTKEEADTSEKPNNLLTRFSYSTLIYMIMILGFFVFRDNYLCRIPIPFTEIELSWISSYIFAVVLTVGTGLLSILFVKKQKCDVISLGITALIPFAILLNLVMYRNYRVIALCVFGISAVSIFLMWLFYKKSDYVRYLFRDVILWTLSLMVLVGVMVPEFVPPKFYESNRYEVKIETGVGMIESNIEVLKNLKPKVFNKLSLEERLDVLNLVVKIETKYWALPECPRLIAEDLPQNTNADHSYEENTIRIRRDLLKYGKAKNCLRTILHEMYHAVQHQMVEAYETLDEQYKDMRFFNMYSVYKKEFEDYASNGLDYALQKVEMDAGEYADYTVKDYYEKINKLLKEEK